MQKSQMPGGSLALLYANHPSVVPPRDACVEGTPFFKASSMAVTNVSISSSVV
jgi:hypothetical protein